MFHSTLTHWGRVTHICVSKLTIIGSDNVLSPDRRQAIIWTNAGLLLIGPLRTNFSEILIEILKFSFKKMRLKLSSAKRRPFCLGLNVLNQNHPGDHLYVISPMALANRRLRWIGFAISFIFIVKIPKWLVATWKYWMSLRPVFNFPVGLHKRLKSSVIHSGIGSSLDIHSATKIANLWRRTANSKINIQQFDNGILEQLNYIIDAHYVNAKIYVRPSYWHWLGAYKLNINIHMGIIHTRIL